MTATRSRVRGAKREHVRWVATAACGACRRLANSQTFLAAIFVAIVLNAISIGLLTYEGVREDAGALLDGLDAIFLGLFVVEIAIRIIARAPRPHEFFKDGWNLFDFVVVFSVFVPGVGENATLLLVLRLGRVVRIVSLLPDLRVILRGMLKSLPPIGSMAMLALLLIYVYGMVGWMLFHEQDPEHWATVGDAMMNMFIVLTLESWPQMMQTAQEIHAASWIFFVSYVLLASFLLINILIGIVIGSMDEARDFERRERVRRLRAESAKGDVPLEILSAELQADTVHRLLAVRDTITELEAQLGIGRGHFLSQATQPRQLDDNLERQEVGIGQR